MSKHRILDGLLRSLSMFLTFSGNLFHTDGPLTLNDLDANVCVYIEMYLSKVLCLKHF